jgi:uncharacterized membrane protein YfcA
MSQVRAQGTSIATLLLPIGELTFWKYYKAGHVDLKLALLIAVGFTLGGWFGEPTLSNSPRWLSSAFSQF